MVALETLFPALYAVASVLVLAAALSTGLSVAPAVVENDSSSLHLLLLGWLLAALVSLLWTLLCLVSAAFAALGSGKLVVVSLALAAAAGLALVALPGSPALVVLYCLAATSVGLAAHSLLPRLLFALAALRTALRALTQLPQLFGYALCLLAGYGVWLAMWVVAALGLASSSQEVFATDGTVFPAGRCVAHRYSKVSPLHY